MWDQQPEIFLGREFEIKDLGLLRYFFRIEVVRFKNNISLELKLGYRPCETPIESNYRL